MLRVLLIFILFLPVVDIAADENPTALSKDELLNLAQNRFESKKTIIETSANTSLLENLTGESRESYLKHLVDHEIMKDNLMFANNKEASGFNFSVFKWQRFSTKIVFWTVIILVALGALLSIVQFYKSYKVVSRSETELSISDKGFTLKTSVVGLVILGFSLAFFYFYIAYVYPISVLSLN